jgi:hypothetical protein
MNNAQVTMTSATKENSTGLGLTSRGKRRALPGEGRAKLAAASSLVSWANMQNIDLSRGSDLQSSVSIFRSSRRSPARSVIAAPRRHARDGVPR